MRSLKVAFVFAAAVATFGAMGASSPAIQGAKPAAAPKFIGAAKCKNCHSVAGNGDQYGKWKASKHSQAFAALSTPDAAKFAKEKGIDDPTKSEKCTKCHTTAFGEAPERLAKGFDTKDVQCEVCHGPGEKHMKARMAAAAAAGDNPPTERQKVGADEICATPDLKLCLNCHNKESPTFKDFCFKKRIKEIEHLDPRVQRTKEQIDALGCKCSDTECKCATGECGAPKAN